MSTPVRRTQLPYQCRPVPPARPVPSLEEDARAGLLRPPRRLPPKYFYDATGSELFDRICQTPEYYPTRTEAALLEAHAGDVIGHCRPDYILELGSGTARKTRHLFDSCEARSCYPQYWPMDVCEPMLLDTGESLTAEYGWMTVRALLGDYHGGLANFPDVEGRGLYLFLGGTIGNFEHDQAVALLRELSQRMRRDDRLLLGADRVKDAGVLRAAYNDAAGITAEFNLNVFRVLNRELDADFDLSRFRHRAEYNAAERQIEMYLIADGEQSVTLGALNADIRLAAGERILTEISRKFTGDSLAGLLGESGFVVERHYQADTALYSLVLARPAPADL